MRLFKPSLSTTRLRLPQELPIVGVSRIPGVGLGKQVQNHFCHRRRPESKCGVRIA